MKLYELFAPEVDEDWKHNLAAAGIGAAMALGGGQALNKGEGSELAKAQVKSTLAKSLTGADALKYAAIKAGLKGTELSQLLAQAAHETMNFARLVEIGDEKYFTNRYDITKNPAKARALGNVKPGDGVKYKGRGYLQITGRYNYRKAGHALGLPLEQHPEMLEKPEVAAKAAIWYWQHRVQPKVSDYSDTKAATKPINPGLKGLPDRIKKFVHYDKLHKDAQK